MFDLKRERVGFVGHAVKLGTLILFVAGVACVAAPPQIADVFDQPSLLTVKVDLSLTAASALQKDPRTAVRATVFIGSSAFSNVALHIKGGQGSFRPLEHKPALTLNFDKFQKGQRFQGMRKIHLNNSVQDPSYLCEDVAGELFRRAGVPAPRTAWALVEINHRQRGLYVVKESFSKEFLRHHFKRADGNLYDGGNSHHEVTEDLELDSGDGPENRSDLRTLAAAAQLPVEKRWAALQQVLDVDQFASFVATEVIANHIDGYSLMQNNYRLYFDPEAKRAVFLPHGMDRVFYEPTAAFDPIMRGLVAAAFIATPEGKELYRKRVREICQMALRRDWITNRIDSAVKLLEKAEPLVPREAAALRERVLARVAFAEQQVRNQGEWSAGRARQGTMD